MDSARARMVADQLRPNGISDERVLAAMAEIPRELFVPPNIRASAYDDRALPIGWNQTISQPLIVASMTQALRLDREDRVLEIGTGSGYQAAVLSLLCAAVVTVEREPDLAQRAAATIKHLKLSNVEVVLADGRQGWPARAPYQGILVAAAADKVPPALVEQLDDGGRMVIPVEVLGEQHQDLRLIKRRGNSLETHILFPVMFVPLLRGLQFGMN